jgi:putative sigma-54 modulation protein
MTVNIESVHFTADVKLIEYIEQKVNKLEKLYNKSTDVKVFLKLENSGQVKDKVSEIRLRVPGQDIFAKATSKSFEASFDEALESMKRQIKKYKEKSSAH